jgi:SAM-dependent methyltransferase
MNKLLTKAADYWGNRHIKEKLAQKSATKALQRTHWYHHEAIIKHTNKKVCDVAVAGRFGGLMRRIYDYSRVQAIKKGISIGCGDARHEIQLLHKSIVHTFDCYEISKDRINAGKLLAKKHNVEGRINFHLVTQEGLPEVSDYDLVFWKAALHHMPNVEEAINWSKQTLAVGGLFAMEEYCGPNHFQWTKLNLEISNRIRAALPKRLFLNSQNKEISRLTPTVKKYSLIEKDPTEATDSYNIVPALRKVLPHADIRVMGGSIWHLTGRQIFQNFIEEEDEVFIELLLILDDLMTLHGDFHYAAAFARKNA